MPAPVDVLVRLANPPAPPAADAASPRKRVAVLVCHGMGEQVPFETIDTVARQVAKVAEDQHHQTAITVEQVANEGSSLPRAELNIRIGQKHVEAHFYEAYWAPLTAGKVTIRDTLSFLRRAGWRAFKFARRDGAFDRWMFGDKQTFEIPARRVLELFVATTVVIAFTAALASSAVLFAATLLHLVLRHTPTREALTTLTVAGLFALGTIAVIAPAGYALTRKLWRTAATGPTSQPSPEGDRQMALYLSVALVIVAVALSGWASRELYEEMNEEFWWFAVVATIGNLVALALFYVARMIRDYPGDVAAYVSSFEVSKFAELRSTIQRTGRTVARYIYGLREADGRLFYDEVVIVGHSLGSVVAYDTVNDALNRDAHLHGWDDKSAIGALSVNARTKLLLTFGSPLDKTAFIFRTQKSVVEFPIREALAAAMQPMIVSYDQRSLRWINVYSPSDWISGALHYYDPPLGDDVRRVENVQAKSSRLPWVAHVEYWERPLVRGFLYEALTGVRPADVAGEIVRPPAT